MYFHNGLIPRGAYFLLPLESKQEATIGWNFTKCISEVKVNQLKVKNMHVKMGISTFKSLIIQHKTHLYRCTQNNDKRVFFYHYYLQVQIYKRYNKRERYSNNKDWNKARKLSTCLKNVTPASPCLRDFVKNNRKFSSRGFAACYFLRSPANLPLHYLGQIYIQRKKKNNKTWQDNSQNKRLKSQSKRLCLGKDPNTIGKISLKDWSLIYIWLKYVWKFNLPGWKCKMVNFICLWFAYNMSFRENTLVVLWSTWE